MGHVVRLNNKQAAVLKRILNSSAMRDLEAGSAEHQAAIDLDLDFDEVNDIAIEIWRKIQPTGKYA